ncbi:XRE family transcriptional regulator [Sphaerisporangium album]|uniref:XRE family transcriptional regulator n=1 Tax=Sphaerisporangium album TaxID=509200 RepID=A0A367FHU4_9ACTN|nr:helix-turn-helix transcriptional regulator [Sphaerisporangium album]RCG29479.1 XRE family transcriptional regulator [Sphaerisporangium album]
MHTTGEVIRELRLHQGWSQSTLATKLCEEAQRATVTREDVSRWELGKRTPGPFWLRHLATVLEVPLTALESDPVKRRTFLTNVAATAIAPVVASDLIEHGFAAALTKRPTLDHWHAKLAAYGNDYMSLGASEIQRRLASDLVVLQQQVDKPRIWDVAAKLMTLYGKTFPGNDGSKAVNWYLMAMQAADRSEDDSARVWVRGRAAIALGYEGASLSVAETFANQALAISDKPSLGRLNALFGKAHVAAIRGDGRAAKALLEEGRRVFDVAGSEEQESDYAVPLWRVNVFTSLLAARLGDERTALRAQEVAAKHLPASLPRFATHLEMHRGLMLARAGDRTGGVVYARSALDKLPPEKHSLTLRMLMSEIEQG